MTDDFDPYAAPTAAARHYAREVDDHLPPLASLGARFAGRLIDTILMMALGFFAAIVIGVFMGFESYEAEPGEEDPLLGLLLIGTAGTLYFGLQTFLLVTRSQSLGKIICGIRIHKYRSPAPASPMATVLMRGVIPYVINMVVCFFGLVDALFIFGKERRCLHDLMANTDVRVSR